jgi:hypothetical protein
MSKSFLDDFASALALAGKAHATVHAYVGGYDP